jgi:uncharacterized protein Yka (UPF0111/DUF47 family)
MSEDGLSQVEQQLLHTISEHLLLVQQELMVAFLELDRIADDERAKKLADSILEAGNQMGEVLNEVMSQFSSLLGLEEGETEARLDQMIKEIEEIEPIHDDEDGPAGFETWLK